MLFRVWLAALLVLTPPLAHACGPFPFRSYVSPVVVKEVVVEKEVPVFATVFVPAYGVGYPPPPPVAAPTPAAHPPQAVGAAPSSCEQRAAELERRLADLEKRLAGSTATPGGTPPAVASVPPAGKDALPLFQARCAACHGAAVAPGKGGNFVLLDQAGKLAPLTDRQLRKIGTLTYNGSMPKGGPPLTDEEIAAIQGWLNSQK